MSHLEEKNVGESVGRLKDFIDAVPVGADQSDLLEKKQHAEQALKHIAGIHNVLESIGIGNDDPVKCCCAPTSNQSSTLPVQK